MDDNSTIMLLPNISLATFVNCIKTQKTPNRRPGGDGGSFYGKTWFFDKLFNQMKLMDRCFCEAIEHQVVVVLSYLI